MRRRRSKRIFAGSEIRQPADRGLGKQNDFREDGARDHHINMENRRER
jgi:hypothetical protein